LRTEPKIRKVAELLRNRDLGKAHNTLISLVKENFLVYAPSLNNGGSLKEEGVCYKKWGRKISFAASGP
jgi:hypothetical protein